MTPQQSRTLRFLESYIADHGFSPSYEDIRVGLGFSSKHHVHRLVYALKAQGRITLRPGRDRSIEILRAPADLATYSIFELESELKRRYASLDALLSEAGV